METTRATFSKIQKTLQDLISSSKDCIKISVAWFTNKELLGLLTDKAKNGLNIEIIISDDINNKRLSSKDFVENGGHLMIYKTDSGRFLHDKFAIFDNRTVVVGSYNWTHSAEYHNSESVVITNNEQVIKQFDIRFQKQKEQVQQFNKSLLTNQQFISADKIEEKFANLESDLEYDFIKAIEESRKIHAKIDFDFVLNFIKSYGAIGATKRLMQTGTDKIQSGFKKMWELNRMDLTFESIIVKEKYKVLFDENTVKTALERLKKFEKQK